MKRNRLLHLILLVSIFPLSGCWTTYAYVHDRHPIIEIPPAPVVEQVSSAELIMLSDDTRDKILNTVASLEKGYAQLRSAVEGYNEYARKKNVAAQQNLSSDDK